MKDCDSWNHKQHRAGFTLVYDPMMMTGRISKQFCTSGVPSGGLNENLRTKRNFWNVPDQIVTSSSWVTTAVFFMSNLGSLYITFVIYYLVGIATRQQHRPRQVFPTVRPSAFSSNYQYPLVCLRSSSSCLHLFPGLPVTSFLYLSFNNVF